MNNLTSLLNQSRHFNRSFFFKLIWSLLLLMILSASLKAQNAYELKKGSFYHTFEKKSRITDSDRVSHTPLMIDKAMSEEFFYQGRDQILQPLMDSMNQHLDSLSWSQSLAVSLPETGLPYLFVGSSEAETAPDATMMMMEEHHEYPPMALYLEKPSREWKSVYTQIMSEQEMDYAILIWIGLTEYPKADKGLFKKKVILGTGYEREIRFLSAVDKPVEVLQLTGVLMDKEGNVIRAGAEGFLHEDSPFWVQVFDAGTTVDDTAIRKLLASERREDLPGKPLAWKVALEQLIAQLTQQERVL